MDKNFSYFLKELNKEQKEAVLSKKNKICLIAGAGCGKTRTLVGRLIWLLYKREKEEKNTKQIIVLTFTRKAISEIQQRVYRFQSPWEKDGGLKILNFHSFCFEILVNHVNLLGFNKKNFVIYDSADQLGIIRNIISRLEEEEKINQREVLEYISSFKNQKHKMISKYVEIFKKYQFYLEKNEALDFTDILIKAIWLLKNQPNLLTLYQEKISDILVDETQDLNSLQWQIIWLLSSKNQNVFLVGDPNQAIYGFQGANPQTICSLVENKEWEKMFLKVNYRSVGKIISVANSFLKNNSEMIQNYLIENKDDKKKGIVRFVCFSNFQLVQEIAKLKEEENLSWSDIAIIYRSNYLSWLIETELIRKGIFYEILGSYLILEREEVKDVMCLIKSFIFQDDLSLIRTLKWQAGVGETTIEKIVSLSAENERTIFQLLLSLEKTKEISENEKKILRTKKSKESLLLLIDKLNEWENKTKKLLVDTAEQLSRVLLELLVSFGYEDYQFRRWKLNLKEFKRKKKNILQFFLSITSWWEKKKISEKKKMCLFDLLQSFVNWTVTNNGEEDSKKNKKKNDSLILASVHQVKGLEFEAVFFVYLNEGIIPNKKSEDILEEKRIFYVGLTRAKRFLFLVSNVDSSRKRQTSPFLYGLLN